MNEPRLLGKDQLALALGAATLVLMPPVALLAGLRFRKSQIELVLAAALVLSLCVASIACGVASLTTPGEKSRVSAIAGLVMGVVGVVVSAAAGILGIVMHWAPSG